MGSGVKIAQLLSTIIFLFENKVDFRSKLKPGMFCLEPKCLPTKNFWTPYPTRMSVKKCTKAKLKCLKPKPKISYFLWPLMFSGIDIAIFPPNNCRLSDICNNLQ